ncbi:MAG: thioredoxin family protein [bacterium]|nr:thioredoxin family protein [bacterium]
MNRHQATMRPAAGRGNLTTGLLAAMALAMGASSAAAQVPADAVFSGFKPSGDFFFELGGETLENAEIFLSDKAAAYLVIAPELASPVLISPRTQSVETVSFMKVAKREDGTIDLLADASFNRLGSFKLQQQEVVFQVKGKTAKLKRKPPLLGQHPADTLRSYKPEYGRNADAYKPIEKAVASLRKQSKDVRVLVYFGTWCPVCGRQVPKIIKVADQLEGSKVGFEYYGLPQPMTDDPKTKEDDVHGVPTAIVYVGGKEIGRLTGGDLNSPEKAIYQMING